MRRFISLLFLAAAALCCSQVSEPEPPTYLRAAAPAQYTGAAPPPTPFTLPSAAPVETPPATIPPVLPDMTYLGVYKVTHYTPDPAENAGYTTTSTGLDLEDHVGDICAVNLKDIPMGVTLYIEGYGYLNVQDTGCRRGIVDVLVSDSETAEAMGVVKTDVWLVG